MSVPVSPTISERCLTCLYQSLLQVVRDVSHICTSLSYKQWQMSHMSVPVSPTSSEKMSHMPLPVSPTSNERCIKPVSPVSSNRCLTHLYQSLLQAVGDVPHQSLLQAVRECLTCLYHYQSLLQAVRDVSHICTSLSYKQ